MSEVYLHKAGGPDPLLGHVKNDGRVLRSKPGPDTEIGHVDVQTGKIYAKRLGPDKYLGRVDLDDGRIFQHVPAGRDEYLGRVHENGAMYSHVPGGPDDYIGKLADSPSFAHTGAAFLLLVLPRLEDDSSPEVKGEA
jgi:hypothetical protein